MSDQDNTVTVNPETTTDTEERSEMTTATEIYEAHPIANLFPMMEENLQEGTGDLLALREGIRRDGLREKIVLYQGKILDGRNRYRACAGYSVPRWKLSEKDDAPFGLEWKGDKRVQDTKKEGDADVPLWDDIPAYQLTEDDFTEFTGTYSEAITMVMSLNAERRHLTNSQRAIVAAKLALDENMVKQGSGPLSKTEKDRGIMSGGQVANMFNIGRTNYVHARAVVEHVRNNPQDALALEIANDESRGGITGAHKMVTEFKRKATELRKQAEKAQEEAEKATIAQMKADNEAKAARRSAQQKETEDAMEGDMADVIALATKRAQDEIIEKERKAREASEAAVRAEQERQRLEEQALQVEEEGQKALSEALTAGAKSSEVVTAQAKVITDITKDYSHLPQGKYGYISINPVWDGAQHLPGVEPGEAWKATDVGKLLEDLRDNNGMKHMTVYTVWCPASELPRVLSIGQRANLKYRGIQVWNRTDGYGTKNEATGFFLDAEFGVVFTATEDLELPTDSQGIAMTHIVTGVGEGTNRPEKFYSDLKGRVKKLAVGERGDVKGWDTFMPTF